MYLTMMVLSVCLNDIVHLQEIYINISFYQLVLRFGSSCDFLITIWLRWLSVYYKGIKQIS